MIDFDERLKSLKNRRQGTRQQAIFDSADTRLPQLFNDSQESTYFSKSIAALSANFDIRADELFERITEAKGVKYSIGAMDAVDKEYTKESIDEGNRVADNLILELKPFNITATKRLQGSVALDIHLERHSDVDILIVISSPVLTEKPNVYPGNYSPASDTRPMVDIVKELRSLSELILPCKYPNCVKTDGSKSISLEGKTLSRKVDIVPSCWYDSRSYQASNNEHDRGIHIYSKHEHKLHLNYPFTHIKRVNDKDAKYSGNLKSVIRLMKTIVADMPDTNKQKAAKKLTSYDLAAIGYHMDDELRLPSYMRLGLVEKTRQHLENLRRYQNYRDSLDVPDGTRKIFNDPEKITALRILSEATEELAKSIFEELNPYGSSYDPNVILQKAIFI